jgi:hypothetical protein
MRAAIPGSQERPLADTIAVRALATADTVAPGPATWVAATKTTLHAK